MPPTSIRARRNLALVSLLLAACGGTDRAPQRQAQQGPPVAQGAVLPAPSAADYANLVQMVYVAYFGRPADPGGLDYYAQMYAGHGAATTLAEFNQSYGRDDLVRATIDGFGASRESAALYSGDNDAFITAIYQNLFNRAPDTAGKQYWVGLLDTGAMTRGNAAVALMAGAIGADMQSVEKKALVAAAYTGIARSVEPVAVYNTKLPGTLGRDTLRTVTATTDVAAAVRALEQRVLQLLSIAAAPASPVAPRGVTAVAGDGRVFLQFTHPLSSGAGPITGFTAACSADGVVTSASSATSPVVVAGLPNGVAQSCTVAALGGGGEPGAVSAAVAATPRTDAVLWPAPVKLAATGLATVGAGRAHIAFEAPAGAGGARPTDHIATCSAPGDVKTGIASASPVLVEGLLHGREYACTVRSSSAAGVSPESALVAAVIPVPNENRLRFVYAIPLDRQYNPAWSRALQSAAAQLQQWYKLQLNGPTFTVHAIEPEICYLPRVSSAYFSSNTWNTVSSDLRTHCGASFSRTDTDWVVFADVLHELNTPGRLGAGTPGLTMMPRQDLEAFGGAACTTSDEGTQICQPLRVKLGGAAHEIGHSLGLPHPPGCDQNLPACDTNARMSIMYSGYGNYPDTYFLPDDKTILLNSRFIR